MTWVAGVEAQPSRQHGCAGWATVCLATRELELYIASIGASGTIATSVTRDVAKYHRLCLHITSGRVGLCGGCFATTDPSFDAACSEPAVVRHRKPIDGTSPHQPIENGDTNDEEDADLASGRHDGRRRQRLRLLQLVLAQAANLRRGLSAARRARLQSVRPLCHRPARHLRLRPRDDDVRAGSIVVNHVGTNFAAALTRLFRNPLTG